MRVLTVEPRACQLVFFTRLDSSSLVNKQVASLPWLPGVSEDGGGLQVDNEPLDVTATVQGVVVQVNLALVKRLGGGGRVG